MPAEGLQGNRRLHRKRAKCIESATLGPFTLVCQEEGGGCQAPVVAKRGGEMGGLAVAQFQRHGFDAGAAGQEAAGFRHALVAQPLAGAAAQFPPQMALQRADGHAAAPRQAPDSKAGVIEQAQSGGGFEEGLVWQAGACAGMAGKFRASGRGGGKRGYLLANPTGHGCLVGKFRARGMPGRWSPARRWAGGLGRSGALAPEGFLKRLFGDAAGIG